VLGTGEGTGTGADVASKIGGLVKPPEISDGNGEVSDSEQSSTDCDATKVDES
jgi:hypothetical protein